MTIVSLLNEDHEITWSYSNKKWYMSLGYVFTDWGNSLIIPSNHLSHGCDKVVSYICNTCNQVFSNKICQLYANRRSNGLDDNIDLDICKDCSSKKGYEKRKHSYNHVKKVFEDGGCKLLSNIYKNSSTPLEYLCSCGNRSKISFSSFKEGHRCRNCLPERNKTSLLSFEYVYKYFQENGCELISQDYFGASIPLEFKCRCGELASARFDTFQRTKRCKKCGYKLSSDKLRQKLTIDDISKAFLNEGCILVTTQKEYHKSNQLLVYICSCGNQGQTRYHDFLKGSRCKSCKSKKLSELRKGKAIPGLQGDKNPNWRGDKLAKERIERRSYLEYKVWRENVYKRDKYTCQCCGDNKGGNLKAHHLDGYEWCIPLRLDISNGITLCDTCHNDFHGLYGTYGNTKEQWLEYMNNLLLEDPVFNLI